MTQPTTIERTLPLNVCLRSFADLVSDHRVADWLITEDGTYRLLLERGFTYRGWRIIEAPTLDVAWDMMSQLQGAANEP